MAGGRGACPLTLKCEASTKARRAVAPHLPRAGILASQNVPPSSELRASILLRLAVGAARLQSRCGRSRRGMGERTAMHS